MINHTGSVLAFIGDAVLSLQVREYLIKRGFTKSKDLQSISEAFVSARSQAEYSRYLLEQFPLSTEELEMFKRGRNHKSDTIPKNADVQTYRLATGLEALWGYLYLTDNRQRLEQLWDIYKTFTEENYGTIYIR